MRTPLFILFLILFPSFLSLTRAQTERDLLRYSENALHGSARYIGLGGAMGAVGGDISSIRSNPAGIALFRKNELSFTPSFNRTRSQSRFMGETASREKYGLAIEQAGLVLERPSDRSGWKRFPIALSYERVRGFNMRTRIRSGSPDRSLLDRFVRISNGIPLSELNTKAPFTGEMAYQTFLMDPSSDSSKYTHRLEGASHSMEREVERSGSMGKARLSFAADRKDRFYFGGSLGIPLVNFERKSTHIETVKGGSDVRDLRYEEELSLNAYGLDLELGAIFRPNADWRFGVSGRSPGFLRIEEKWSTRLKADHGATRSYDEGPVRGEQAYRVRLPYRLMGSAARFFGKNGLIALEYRFQERSNGELLSSQGGSERFEASNRIIDEHFRPKHALKAGMEWRYAPYYLRGGYNLSTPAQSDRYGQEEAFYQRYTVGAGFRKEAFFLDLAYRWSLRPETTEPIDPGYGQVARTVHRMGGLAITGGARF